MVLLIVLGAALAWFVIYSLSKPSELYASLPKTSATYQLALLAECAKANIELSYVQTTFALLAGYLLVVVGVLIFAAGFVGTLNIEGQTDGTTLSVAASAPGIVAIVLGGAIIYAGVSKQIDSSLFAEITEPTSVKVKTEQKPPPIATTGEDSSDGKGSNN